MKTISLDYGREGRWETQIPVERFLYIHEGPSALPDPNSIIAESLRHPIEFPALNLAIVPGDRIVIVIDRGISSAAEIVSEIWSFFAEAGIDPENVLILQPASIESMKLKDPRRLLPVDIRDRISWKIHDPTVENGTGYLASSASGERIYLAREILDADFILPVSRLGFDAMLGRRELTSSFYPGLSTPDAFSRTLGQGHRELGPDDERPLRQLVHEVAWLLGIQFAIQVLSSRGHGGIAGFLAGNTDHVAKRGKELLDYAWRISLDQRGETAVIALPESGDEATWSDLGSALEAAQKIVVQGGRIIVLSELAASPGAGVDIIRSSRSAKAALQPLRKAAPADLLSATQIASAADWASIYLLSHIDSRIVEESFMTPLESEQEASRLLETCDGLVIIPGAQHVYCELNE